MNFLIIAMLILLGGPLIWLVVALLFQEGRIEVNPMSAVVYKNLWTGKAYAILPGTQFIIPGIHKRLVDVSLKNEPSDPPITNVVTADPIQVGVDYVVYTFQIPKDEMAIVKAATVIDYNNRQQVVIDRIEAELQAAFGEYKFDEVYKGNTIDRKVLKEIADKANTQLTATVESEWGIHVQIRIEDIDFPGKIQEAITEAVTAEREGKAIKDKASAAGVDPRWIAVGEMVSDAVSILKGEGK